ncbi:MULTISPECIES: aldo/keto reductase [unclassified Streptomyces]|uniref:aldo/keto reductase n=1 Tax=unclassified Streptomyces TaxID=2593676 RepID=UPI002E2C8BD8|nr:aldo/keto reductase [Streptomyces sp. NBC_00223]
MRVTTLGRSGPEVGVVGLGCMGMTHAYDPVGRDDATSVDVIRQAVDLGANLIDTSDVYGPFTNEELVGRALVGTYRERAVLATKVGLVVESRTGDRIVYGHNGTPEHIRRSIDGSLLRLGTDHVDLYQLHRVDPAVPIEETWGAMAEAVESGKVRTLGLSEVGVPEIQRADRVHPVASVQSELSLWTRETLTEVLPYCDREGIAFLPFAPLGRGFLAGRFSSFEDLPADDVRRSYQRFQQDALHANLTLVGRVRALAERIGATPAQVALAWVIAQGRHVIPIPGTKTPKYLMDNVGAAQVTLTAEDLAELDMLPEATGARF